MSLSLAEVLTLIGMLLALRPDGLACVLAAGTDGSVRPVGLEGSQ